LRALCRTTGDDPIRLALTGGEDYRLLVAVDPSGFDDLRGKVSAATGRELHDVGTIVAEPGILVRARDGSLTSLSASGWDHFTSATSESIREDETS
jgi:thiamine-monophosphate kinase